MSVIENRKTYTCCITIETFSGAQADRPFTTTNLETK